MLLGFSCAAAALAFPGRAPAHVTITPAYVEADAPTTIRFETPNERKPHATVSLSIEAPPGVAFSAVAAPSGWKLDVQPTRVRWTGGRIEGTRTIAFPIRVLHALGAPALLLSNAAGGIRRSFTPGDLMIIRDHVNLTWQNPLTGAVVPGDERFPDMSEPWDSALRALLAQSAAAVGVQATEGVYFGLTGPSYETPAEVRMLERMGADAVGMSTVSESVAAATLGIPVAGVSLLTNYAAGLTRRHLTHDEVTQVAERTRHRLERLVRGFVRRLREDG